MVMCTDASMENLMTVEPATVDDAKPTMLNYLINAYNMTQAMWYGEIYANGLGGHVRGILDNDLGYITGGLEKLRHLHTVIQLLIIKWLRVNNIYLIIICQCTHSHMTHMDMFHM